VSPGPEALAEGTLEIAVVCTGREKGSHNSPLQRFRERRVDSFPSLTRGPPHGPAGNAVGPGRIVSGVGTS